MAQDAASIAMKRNTLECRIDETRVRLLVAIELQSIVAKLQKLNSSEAMRIGDELLDLADVYLKGNE
ncbi:hypothetical protein HNQ50_001391 [Silvimonas terrae]|uniref:Uncharacterized protein n=1 Tax=Silvimonas terrae TaxID=300266 RepID=A0A840RB69_9NEIS|nr:hypothetical protein [Silvimonas terrae]MBB5190669.1 hypothetical protein [Silvimonas terrae]